jgi:hypothetical protein
MRLCTLGHLPLPIVTVKGIVARRVGVHRALCPDSGAARTGVPARGAVSTMQARILRHVGVFAA